MPFRLTPIVRNLLIINVVMFILSEIMIESKEYLSLYHHSSPFSKPFQLLSHMFMHGGIGHLISNMLPLVFLGPMLEDFLGEKKFLILYMIAGVGASLLYSGIKHWEYVQLQASAEQLTQNMNAVSLKAFVESVMGPKYRDQLVDLYVKLESYPDNAILIESGQNVVGRILDLVRDSPMVGASGAIFGILFAAAYFFPNVEIMLLFPPIPMKLKIFVGIYAVIELIMGVNNSPGDNVAHFAHLGGILFAFLVVIYWKRQQGGRRYN